LQFLKRYRQQRTWSMMRWMSDEMFMESEGRVGEEWPCMPETWKWGFSYWMQWTVGGSMQPARWETPSGYGGCLYYVGSIASTSVCSSQEHSNTLWFQPPKSVCTGSENGGELKAYLVSSHPWRHTSTLLWACPCSRPPLWFVQQMGSCIIVINAMVLLRNWLPSRQSCPNLIQTLWHTVLVVGMRRCLRTPRLFMTRYRSTNWLNFDLRLWVKMLFWRRFEWLKWLRSCDQGVMTDYSGKCWESGANYIRKWFCGKVAALEHYIRKILFN
jgi:hypothetical protein